MPGGDRVARARRGGPAGRRAAARRRPADGRRSRILISVDLPAPFSPSSAWIAPGARLESRHRSSAFTPGKVLRRRAPRARAAVIARASSARPRTSRRRLRPTAARIRAPSTSWTRNGSIAEQDQRVGDQRHDQHAEAVPATETWPPVSDGAAEHRGGEGEDQPVVADRWAGRPAGAPRPASPASAASSARERVRRDDRRGRRDARQLGGGRRCRRRPASAARARAGHEQGPDRRQRRSPARRAARAAGPSAARCRTPSRCPAGRRTAGPG